MKPHTRDCRHAADSEIQATPKCFSFARSLNWRPAGSSFPASESFNWFIFDQYRVIQNGAPRHPRNMVRPTASSCSYLS